MTYESIDAWIERQPWTELGKAQAREIVYLCEVRKLNNPSLATWRRLADRGKWETK